MPAKTSPRTTSKTSNGPTTRRPNGNGGGPKPSGPRTTSNGTNFFPVELVSSGPLDLTLEGRDGDDFGLAVCSRCAAVIPGSDRGRVTHSSFHEQLDGLDQRVG